MPGKSSIGGCRRDHGGLGLNYLLFGRALAIREKVLGPEPPDTVKSRNDLARLLKDQDRGGAKP